MRLRLLILLLLGAALGLLPQMPAPLRLAGMGILLWVLPGWGWRRIALAGEPASLVDHAAFVALAPWAVHGIVAPLVAPLGIPPEILTISLSAIGIALAFVPGLDRQGPHASLAEMRGGGFDRLVLALAVLLAVALWVRPPFLGLGSDVYAHLAAIRACVEEGRIFPLHEFYPPAQGTGADPRFGAGHAYYAAWASLAKVTPLQVWHGVGPLAWAGLLLGMGSLIRAACESTLGRGLALLVFVAAYGGDAYDPLRVAAYPLWLGLGLAWLAMSRVLRDGRDASARTPLGAALLVAGAGGLHALAFLLGAGMMAVGRFVARFSRRRWWNRALWMTVAVSLPVMGARFWISYGNVNPIHQKPWETMQWAPGWVSASPSLLLQWLWPLGVIGLLLIPSLLRQASDRESARWSSALALISLLWLVTPLLLTPSIKVLGFLPLRLVLTILFPLLIGQWIDGRGLGPLRPTSFVGGALAAVLALVLAGQRVASLWDEPGNVVVRAPQWSDLMTQLRDHVDPQAVILSDPYTMLAVKAMAPQSIVAVPDGRSSPRDAHSIDRLRASWRAMSASTPSAETDAILEEYGITHVVLDELFAQDEISYEYPVMPSTFAAQRAKFLQNPDRFEVVWRQEKLVLLRVKDGVWDESYLTPCVEPRQAAPVELPLADGFALLDPQVQWTDDHAWRLTGRLAWDGEGSPPFRYFVLRADRVPSPVPPSLRATEKPVRKALERWRRATYRQRWTRHVACPTYLLDGQTQLPFTFDLRLPTSMGKGEYALSLQVSDFTGFMRLRPRDFVRDDDAYSGPTLATLAMPRPAEPAAGVQP